MSIGSCCDDCQPNPANTVNQNDTTTLYHVGQYVYIHGEVKCKIKSLLAPDSSGKTRYEAEVVGIDGNYLKFMQTPKLLPILLDNYGKTFVEASPNDKIWGIGMREDDPGVENPKNWKGQNLLGQALTETCDVLYNTVFEQMYNIEKIYEISNL